MAMQSDWLVVGSGLTGSVIARTLIDNGQKVLVVDRRPHLGGNVHDYSHPCGVRVHTYGPHYFRTNDMSIWNFVNRFTRFHGYEARLKTWVDGAYQNWPVTDSYIQRLCGKNWTPEFKGSPTNFEEACLAMMPRVIYEKFVKGYTEKQWGVNPRTLSVSLASRFDVRKDDESRLVRHKYQGIPENGYARFMERMLEGIPTLLNFDYLQHRGEFHPHKMVIFTGPIDEYFNYDLGRLDYRGQVREQEYLPTVEFAQPCGQVNNPDAANGSHIRSLEWKHMMPLKEISQIRGTVITRETTISPADPDAYEYPFPNESNKRLYQAYSERAHAIPSLLVCGRLGEYRYYDMDQAIARAQLLARRIIASAGREAPWVS